MLIGRQLSRLESRQRHAKHPEPVGCKRLDLTHQPITLLTAQMAQINDGLGRTLGRDQAVTPVGRLPDSRHRQHGASQGIVVDQ